MVVEGEVNAVSVTDLAHRVRVPMPICETVNAVLHKGANLQEAFNALWARPIEAEPFALDLSLDHPLPDTRLQFASLNGALTV